MTSTSAGAQVVTSTVREELSLRNLEGVEVMLVDSLKRVVATTTPKADGSFALASPFAGTVTVVVRAPRYEQADVSIRLGGEETVTMSFELIPRAISIPGIEVEIDALDRMRGELANRGIRIEDLGRRFIDSEALEKRVGSIDVGAALESRSIPGVRMVRAENMGPGQLRILCMTLIRGRTGIGSDRCALVVLDGVAVPLAVAAEIPVENLRAVVVLQPTEATTVYGTAGGGGALLLFTKLGRP